MEVEFVDFNVLVGANAAGKSNLIDALRFLRDVERHGLPNAVSMQGGVEYLRNAEIGASQPLEVKATFKSEDFFARMIPRVGDTYMRILPKEVKLTFSLTFPKYAPTYGVLKEEVEIPVEFATMELAGNNRLFHNASEKNSGVLKMHRDGNKPVVSLVYDDEFGGGAVPGFSDFMFMERVNKTEVIWRQFMRFFLPYRSFANISIFDFDPKLPKQSVQITGRQELEEDGSNLALVLQNILRSRQQKRLLTNIVRDLLPFVEKFSVQSVADRSVYFSLHDSYGKSHSGIPAAFMSDGTINVLAIVCAAFFDESSTIVIEEPERNLHPVLISKIVALLRDAATSKQVLLTTHSPEIIKHSGLDSLLFVTRGKDGFTRISRPADSESIKAFLEDEIGVDDLFTQNLLGL